MFGAEFRRQHARGRGRRGGGCHGCETLRFAPVAPPAGHHREHADRTTAGERGEFTNHLALTHPRLWSIEAPHLHQLVTTIRSGGKVIDRYETTFGIRSIRFDPQTESIVGDAEAARLAVPQYRAPWKFPREYLS